MRIQTFSIVVGTSACDGDCEFCVSHTTGFNHLAPVGLIKLEDLATACLAAFRGKCTTILFTGKGEPFLYPNQITEYLSTIEEIRKEYQVFFPFIEVQTNGLRLGRIAKLWAENNPTPECIQMNTQLKDMRGLRLRTIALSTVGIDQDVNKETYLHHQNASYPDLATTIRYLKTFSFQIRLCVMMRQGAVDSPTKVDEVINWCKKNRVDQLTIRPIRKPNDRNLDKAAGPYVEYIRKYGLTPKQETAISRHLWQNGDYLHTLMKGTSHAAPVFSVNGQNVCLSDCLTVNNVDGEQDEIRTLIYYNGDDHTPSTLSHDWQFEGARL